MKVKNIPINESCGYHVHFGVENGRHTNQRIPMVALNNIRNLLYTYEDGLFSLVPEHRRNNSYCRTLDSEHHHSSECVGISFADGVRQGGTTASQIFGSCRYYWLNFASIEKHGTLEFRMPESTTNATDIIGWIEFLTQAIEATVTSSIHYRFKKSESKASVQLHNLLGRARTCGANVGPNVERAKVAREWAKDRYKRVNGKFLRQDIDENSNASDGRKAALIEERVRITESETQQRQVRDRQRLEVVELERSVNVEREQQTRIQQEIHLLTQTLSTSHANVSRLSTAIVGRNAELTQTQRNLDELTARREAIDADIAAL
jgi:hypothetical protein